MALDPKKVTTQVSLAADAAIKAEQAISKARKEDLKEREVLMEEVQKGFDPKDFIIENRWGGARITRTPVDRGMAPPQLGFIPEYITKDGNDVPVCMHKLINGQLFFLSADGLKMFRWCNPRKIPSHKRYGYDFVPFDMWRGSGFYTKGENNTTWNADQVLMWTSIDGWERFCADTERMREISEGEVGQELFQMGEKTGTPTFREDKKRGVREFFT